MAIKYENSYDTYKCKCGNIPAPLAPRVNGISGPRVHPETNEPWCLNCKNEYESQKAGYRNFSHKTYSNTCTTREEADEYFDKIFEAGFANPTDYKNHIRQQVMKENNLKTVEEYIKFQRSGYKAKGYEDLSYIQYGKPIGQLDTICVITKKNIYTKQAFKSKNEFMGKVEIHHDKVSNGSSVDKCEYQPSRIVGLGSFKGKDDYIYELIGTTIMSSAAHTGVHNLGHELDLRCYKTSQLKYALQSEKKYLKVLKYLRVKKVIPYKEFLLAQINPNVPTDIIRPNNIIKKVFGTNDLTLLY